MKPKVFSLFLALFVGWVFFPYSARAEEPHAEKIISEILSTKQSILANAGETSSQQFVFLAFWDFDGTILKGDCSEGMKDGDRQIYKGLAQLAIESGYSEIYPPKGGVDRFWKDYRHMDHNIGRWLAYPFLPQMLRGAKVSDIRTLSSKHFETVLSNYYFESSIRILKALEERKVESHIISASADVFMDAAAPTLGLPLERFNGIELKIENGRLTETLVYPVTWSHGKTRKLISIVEEAKRRDPGKHIVVLAAFGNSYSTDGPFMKYVSTRNLPKGKPLALMINGGRAPVAYQGFFNQVQQFNIVSTTEIEVRKLTK